MKKPWVFFLLQVVHAGLGLLLTHAATAAPAPASDSTPAPEQADVAAPGAGI